MEYTELTVEEQVQILSQRAKQYEAEHFNHAINKELLVATGSRDNQTRAAIMAAEEAMSHLDGAYAATKAKIKALDPKPAKPAKP